MNKFNKLYDLIMQSTMIYEQKHISNLDQVLNSISHLITKYKEYSNGITLYRIKPITQYSDVNRIREALYDENSRYNMPDLSYGVLASFLAFKGDLFLGIGIYAPYKWFNRDKKQAGDKIFWQTVGVVDSHKFRQYLILPDGKHWTSPDQDQWIKNINDKIKEKFIKKYNLKLNPSTGRYDCDGDIIGFTNNDLINYQIPVPLGEVKGSFAGTDKRFDIVSFNRNDGIGTSCSGIETFKNFPTKVGVDFIIGQANIESLEGCPVEVGRNFVLDYARYLKSLMGAPQKVGGHFICAHAYRLTSLVGMPQQFNGDFNLLWDYSLPSLQGGPRTVTGDFNLFKCKNIKSLANAPIRVGGNVNFGQTAIPAAQRAAYKRMIKPKVIKK